MNWIIEYSAHILESYVLDQDTYRPWNRNQIDRTIVTTGLSFPQLRQVARMSHIIGWIIVGKIGRAHDSLQNLTNIHHSQSQPTRPGSLEPTPRWCPPSGSTKLVPQRESTWVTTSGSADTSSRFVFLGNKKEKTKVFLRGWRRTSASWCLSTRSRWPVTGMELELTPTSPQSPWGSRGASRWPKDNCHVANFKLCQHLSDLSVTLSCAGHWGSHWQTFPAPCEAHQGVRPQRGWENP